MKNRPVLLLALSLVVAITSCKKTISYADTPGFPGDPSDYFLPMQIGKYAIYRLDSLTFYYYGQLDTTTSYLAKDSVEKSYTDGSNNTAFIVTRYLSDTLGSSWSPSQSYTVSIVNRQLWMNENNLRYLKMAAPIDEGSSWLGANALTYNPLIDYFDFSADDNIRVNEWNFTYQNVAQPYTVGSTKYDSTVTVLEVNDSANVPIVDPKVFGSKTYWSETYAKHVGLVYRHTSIWEYQPPPPVGGTSGYKIGFEVTMKLQSHN